MRSKTNSGALLLIALVFVVTGSTLLHADTGTCGGQMVTLPFTDVMNNTFFCQIAEAFFSGLTNGTSASTYSPSDPVPREQMAAFVTRTLDQSLRRGSRRAALKQFWTPTSSNSLTLTTIDLTPSLVECDGLDLWVGSGANSTVKRVRSSDGKVIDTWTGATQGFGVLSAIGLIFVTGSTSPGALFQLDPTLPAGAVTTLSSNLGNAPEQLSFDGSRIWTANFSGSVSIVSLNPVSVTTVSTGFTSVAGIVFDGSNMWVTDQAQFSHSLLKLDSNGAIVQAVSVGVQPRYPVFDGTNIWVPNLGSDSVSVVRASTGQLLSTLSGNGLNGPATAAFDGERILVTNIVGRSVSIWRASDLSPLGSLSVGPGVLTPVGACSDGLNFWIALSNNSSPGKLARF